MNWENNCFSPLIEEQTKKHQEQSIKTDCFGISSDSSNLDDAILIKPDYFFFFNNSWNINARREQSNKYLLKCNIQKNKTKTSLLCIRQNKKGRPVKKAETALTKPTKTAISSTLTCIFCDQGFSLK